MVDWNEKFMESFGGTFGVEPEELDLNNPGKLIKLIMKTKGMTNEMLANKAGIHVNTVQGWTSGRRAPTFFNFMVCLNALGYRMKVEADD